MIEEDEIDIRQLIETLKRNRLRIFIITLFTILLSGIYLYLSQAIYSSNVTIALDSQENSQLKTILPGQFLADGQNDERLQLAKVTLKSKKFIDTILDKLDTSRLYFIQKNFKKNEVEKFPNLKIDVNIKDEILDGAFFEIIPQGNGKFLLKIEEIEYRALHRYNDEIKNEKFSLRVIKTEGLDPFVDSFEEILHSYIGEFSALVDKRAYLFQTFSRNKQEDIIIGNMEVSTLSDNILNIVYQDTLPTRTKRVVQEIAKSYIEYNLANKTAELEQTLEFLDKQIIDVKSNLKRKGEKLKQYQQKNSTVTAMESGSTLLDSVEEKKELVEKIKFQIQELTAFRTSLQSGMLSTVSLVSSGIDTSSIQSLMETYRKNDEEVRTLRFQQSDITKSIGSNIQINSLINELKQEESVLQDLRNNFTDMHPQVIEEQNKISDIESKIHATLIANLDKLQRDKAIAKSTILNNMLMVQHNLENKLRRFKSDIREKKALLQSLPAKNMVNQDLQRNFTVSEDIYTFLLQKKIEVQISKASIIANTKILEDAEVAKFPIKPKKKMILLVSLILGVILGLIYIFLREFLDTKVRSVHDVESLTSIPLYGTLPLNNNERFFKEALRNIRTNLQFVLSADKHCTHILISSTVAGEGKTTITKGLAEIIAQADKRVLVLDLDLRKPRLHKELKHSNKIGMSNYLASDIEMKSIVQKINDNLDFISAGSIPPNPSELLMSKKLDEIIMNLAREYDYLLFDTAPIGSVTDANMLLKHTDILLLTVRANEAEKIYLENFNKMIKDKNIKSAGIILNGLKLYKSKGYGYSYGYGYGYDYGYGYGEKKDK